MSKTKTAGRDFDASHCSSRAFRVGDCIILNDVEQPCGRMVCVITDKPNDLGFYSVQYLNADPSFDSYCKPPMHNRLLRATRIEDFGVVIRTDGTHYWCEKVGESKARYPDGDMRIWQEWNGPIKHKARPKVSSLVWPF
jgi:hypothetical protein